MIEEKTKKKNPIPSTITTMITTETPQNDDSSSLFPDGMLFLSPLLVLMTVMNSSLEIAPSLFLSNSAGKVENQQSDHPLLVLPVLALVLALLLLLLLLLLFLGLVPPSSSSSSYSSSSSSSSSSTTTYH